MENHMTLIIAFAWLAAAVIIGALVAQPQAHCRDGDYAFYLGGVKQYGCGPVVKP
jgi:hypothetical protein